MLTARTRVQMSAAFQNNVFIFLCGVSNSSWYRAIRRYYKCAWCKAEGACGKACSGELKNYVTYNGWRHTTIILQAEAPPIGFEFTFNVINDITAIAADGGWQIELIGRNGERYHRHYCRRKREEFVPLSKTTFNARIPRLSPVRLSRLQARLLE